MGWAEVQQQECKTNRESRARRLGVIAVLWLPFPGLALAAHPEVQDKATYHLFNPTPPELRREMSTDRPDQTESPYTVDAGHFQIEMDFANGTIDRDRSNAGDVKSQTWSYGSVNLKAGLLNHVDIQFVLDGHVDSRVQDRVAGTPVHDSGFGDVQTRLKINLWGNDGGTTAFAVMPFIKWPLSQTVLRNGKTEGGVILPLAVALPGGWGMGLMTELDWVRDGAGGFDTEYFNTITFGHDITEQLGGYLEVAALFTPESNAEWQGQVGIGLTYGLNADTQFDLGCNFGVTRAATDLVPFIGCSRRF